MVLGRTLIAQENGRAVILRDEEIDGAVPVGVNGCQVDMSGNSVPGHCTAAGSTAAIHAGLINVCGPRRASARSA